VKRKRTPAPEPVVAAAILEQARRVLDIEPVKKPGRCVVCGEETAPTSTEGLCWVCRRLKFSAWRDSDTQMPAQE
jgi:hypothetical protein